MRHLMLTALLLLTALPARAEGHLIVLMSVDQLRQDYLNRFAEDLRAGGFAMFRTRGAVFTNAHYDYASTETGPGHTTIATGAYGKTHGIVGNDWYDREHGRRVYCVEDSSYSLLGIPGRGRSPRRILGSTIGDELRIGSAFQAKVVSVSFKDRAAIPMGGAQANGAYWIVDSTVVSSTYYMEGLPDWVRRFNAEGHVNRYFGAVWERALPEERYRHLDRDDAPYEKNENGLGRAFPHRIDGGTPERITRAYYAALRSSPFGNQITIALAREALLAEELGQRGVTDLLAVSLSANDYLGHAFGPHSHEVFDLIVRTDSLLAEFWSFLDETVGLEHCTIVLTADHGVAPIPEYVTAHVPGAPTYRVNPEEFLRRLQERLSLLSGAAQGAPGWIERVEGDNVYLNRQAVAAAGVTVDEAARTLERELESFPEVYAAYTRADILDSPATTPVHRRVRNSYYTPRSGDLVFVLKPGLLPTGSPAGSSHGSPYPYDAHVPVMLAGPALRPGIYDAPASPADIAPTLAVMLGIERPSQATGRVLTEALDREETDTPESR